MDAVTFLFFDFDWVLTFCGFITFQTTKLGTLQQGLREEKARSTKKVADQFSLNFTVHFMKRRTEYFLVIPVSPWLPKESFWKLNIKQLKKSSVHIRAEYVWSWEHTQELVCCLISASWLWHPDCIVCLTQTCQAWLSAQQDWCLVRSYVLTAVFRRAIKIKVAATAPLHEIWVHQLFGPDDTGWTPTAMEIIFLFKSFTNYSYYLWIH